MIRWFRRRRPTPAPQPVISRTDADTMNAWEIRFIEWNNLTDQGRAWYRENLTKAPHFLINSR
jgi:hypothetical protein